MQGARQDALVRDTARSLVAFLAKSSTPPRIDIIDPHGDAADWPGAGVLDPTSGPRYRTDVACLRDGALIPELWFDAFFLVTIAAAAPDRSLGLRVILAAQADMLEAPGALDLDAIVAAHRLMSSSLCISCGSITFSTPESGSWWAASPNDLTLERAVAAAAGVGSDPLPIFRHLARHEADGGTMEMTRGEAPTLRGYLEPRWRVGLRRSASNFAHGARRVGQDVRLSAQNLRRLPSFVQRRLPDVVRAWRVT
ncbi:MAG: hypothetical protein HY271_13815 [Deltaproteobacteria bacterium]|nr:hypothetical protein [Deltaproteobacteria bacterium]